MKDLKQTVLVIFLSVVILMGLLVLGAFYFLGLPDQSITKKSIESSLEGELVEPKEIGQNTRVVDQKSVVTSISSTTKEESVVIQKVNSEDSVQSISQVKVISPSVQKFILKSEFLRGDPTAQAIASGKIDKYDIRMFSSIYGEGGPYSTDNFAYKFLSSLRMLGYTRFYKTAGGQYVAEQYLNRAKEFNNLTPSRFVDLAILKVVDSALVDKENIDKNSATKLPIFNRLIDSPLNEPPKEHIAGLLSDIFAALPSNLVIWSEKNFKDFYVRQFGAGARIKDVSNSDYQICETTMYPELGSYCVVGEYFGVSLVNKVPTNSPNFDDFSYASVALHEYGHYLDKKLFNPEPETARGIIDTTGFYDISYDLSDPAPGGLREFAYKRPQNVKNEFVSDYAQGWKRTVDGKDYFSAAEDFAESFSMYVTDGKVFKKLGGSSDVLKQKYDWLKINVFGGREYQSGDILSIATLAQQPNTDITKQSTGAFNVVDYSTSLPNFVWNYKFLNGSLTAKP